MGKNTPLEKIIEIRRTRHTLTTLRTHLKIHSTIQNEILLATLANDGIQPMDLGALLDVQAATISKNGGILEDRGYLKRIPIDNKNIGYHVTKIIKEVLL